MRVRIALAALLSLLLFGMQLESVVHAFQHDQARLALGGKAVVQSSAEGTCATCALIAGGTQAGPASAATPLAFAVASPAAPFHGFSFTPLASFYYASRAPPVVPL